jgi:hypothetical protein
MLCCRTRLRRENGVSCSGSLFLLFSSVTSSVIAKKAIEKNREILLASLLAFLSVLFESLSLLSLLVAVLGVGTRGRG